MKSNFNYINITAIALFVVMLGYILFVLLKMPEPVMWSYRILILLVLGFNYIRYYKVQTIDKVGLHLTYIFMGWLFFSCIRATIYADGYWVWKGIISQLLTVLFYIVILVSTNVIVVQKYFRLYWLFFIPMVMLSYLIDGTVLNANYVPYSVLMLFFALVPKKNKWMLIAIVILFFITNFQRNDLIKIMITSLISISISYLYPIIPKSSIKLARFVFLIAPFVFLYLAIIGSFNVFKMSEYIKGEHVVKVKTTQGVEDDDLLGDSRTFIYENVFYTMNKYDAWVFGRSPAFGDEGLTWDRDLIMGTVGRFGNEVGISDILLWYGLIGVFIYFFIYLRASYLAIYKSRNRYAKGVGLYVAFLWVWSFVWEKPMFETFFMMDLVLLGLCFSKPFRAMTDNEMRIWVRGIFIKPNPKLNPKPL